MPRLRLEPGASVVIEGELAAGPCDREDSGTSYAKLKPGPGRAAADVARNQRLRIQAAMVELLKTQGYEAITVRGLARRANVSTKTFYRFYADREDCFLSLHQQAVRKLLRGVTTRRTQSAAKTTEGTSGADALLAALSSNPEAARVVLVDAYSGGTQMLEQARLAQRSIERCADAGFRGDPDTARSPCVAQGLVAGVIEMARSHLLTDGEASLPHLCERLGPWLCSYEGSLPVDLALLSRNLEGAGSSSQKFPDEYRARASSEVDLLLAAAAKLATEEGGGTPDTRAVLAAAGLPHRALRDNFSSVEHCVATAIEGRALDAIDRASAAGSDRRTAPRHVVASVVALCEELTRDAPLAVLCFGPAAVAGSQRMSLRERVRARAAVLIEVTLGGFRSCERARLQTEAAVAACMGLLQIEPSVSVPGGTAVLGLAPVLSYLILAPAVGTVGATEVIREEHLIYQTKPGRSIQAP